MPSKERRRSREHRRSNQRRSSCDNSFDFWNCCQCSEGIQSLALSLQCSNGQCQHSRCENCGIGGIGGGYFYWDRSSSPLHGTVATPQGLELYELHMQSERISKKLAEMDQLKAVHRSSFDEAVKLHEQKNSALPVDRHKSVLERYLLEIARPTEFVFAWEWSILPFLINILPEWLGRGFAINVSRAPRDTAAQTICFTSKIKPTRIRQIIIARHVLDVIPDRFKGNTAFKFYHGTVDLLQRGTDEKRQDEVCSARNPYLYLLPMMGDSIGPGTDDTAEEESAATLGPCVTFGGHAFWLANLHVFLKRLKKREPYVRESSVLHPGLLDCCEHSVVKQKRVRFGTVCAYSGDDLTTTRPSSHPFWQRFPKANRNVVTDWVLIEDMNLKDPHSPKKLDPFLNTLRIPGAEKINSSAIVTSLSEVLPKANIHTTGRTSGYQCGQISEIPGYVDADEDGRKTTMATREWFIEQPNWITELDDDWLEGGIGVRGDSGAPVIDSDNNSLYGQLWGRNKYWGPGRRFVYFTPISDISNDILEKYPQLEKPLKLPQSCSREREIESELCCPECYAEIKKADSSDGMSSMSISSHDLLDALHTAEEVAADADCVELEYSSTTRSDSDCGMSVDSEQAIISYSPIEREGFDDLLDLLPAASDPDVALAMALDPFQFYGNVDHDFGINDDALSIDSDDSATDEVETIGRSCASGKKSQRVLALEKSFDSWVMVHRKPTSDATLRGKMAVSPKKTNSSSLLNSLLKTSQLMAGLALA